MIYAEPRISDRDRRGNKVGITPSRKEGRRQRVPS